MRKIVHSYGVELDWVDPYAKKMGGEVVGNFVVVPDNINTGTSYFLNCDFGISAFYLDVLYHKQIHFRQVNKSKDFIGIYYNLTEGEAILTADDVANPIGKWGYNLAIVDSSFKYDYIVNSGCSAFALCIFVKKDVIKKYFLNTPSLRDHVTKIFDPKLNTIVKFTRMSNDSYHLLMDLRSKEIESPTFDLYLKGTIQCLLAEYIERLTIEDIVIDTVNDRDLIEILKSQEYLLSNLKEPFPSIAYLAKMANMSGSKYKNLFKKITGLTPNAYFFNNKLLESKKLLGRKTLTIAQVSAELNFSNHSYFAAKFKEFFGMSPNHFIKQLL
ncbi:hypothetical protein B4N84_17295 [Flavobacterium sp. IR1]|nr:hypothetical protein B4N84_17295 [Flavobacterium sp. IR1]